MRELKMKSIFIFLVCFGLAWFVNLASGNQFGTEDFGSVMVFWMIIGCVGFMFEYLDGGK